MKKVVLLKQKIIMELKPLLKTAGVVLLVLCFHQAVTAPLISKAMAPKKPATPPVAK